MRTRKIERRTSGDFERCSISTKAASSTAESVKKPIVDALVQPLALGLDDRVDERHQPAGRGHGARDVERARRVLVPRLRNQAEREDERERCRPAR